jgi:DNA adenine methylase
MAQPVVKFPGGKREHVALDLLLGLDYHYDTYAEIFLGGAAAFCALQEAGKLEGKIALLGDADRDLIALYAAIRKNPHKVHEVALVERDHIASYRTQRERKKSYNNLRDLWNLGSKKPGYQLCLRHACFNGAFRLNKSGGMNMPPRDKLDELALPSVPQLLDFATALEGAELLDWDFREYAERVFIGFGTLVYLDPPYDASFDAYTAEGFDDEDQEDLIKQAAEWAGNGAKVVYSNAATELIRDLLSAHWPHATVQEVTAKHVISCDGTQRGDVAELLVHE